MEAFAGRDFQSTLTVRRCDLALLAPGLSGGTAVALLQGVLGAGGGTGARVRAAGHRDGGSGRPNPGPGPQDGPVGIDG